ncbi:hypothetical protein E4U42_002820 [Claviceps africana]|uniref:CCD97-like C-terminal domain-containing protein n=1 Tax=Claviceps africana TaxID=83212 RepID=A0A8K0NIB7_9HYPO|nr:hypothetical protein E4U42_002820 [Claviceps africana]
MSSPSKHHVTYDKPVPRPAKSPAKTAQIRTQNRRREYLERHPAYFDSADRELADPVLYERLIRRHQTPQERQTDHLRKGYAHVLEARLARGEPPGLRAPSAWAPSPHVEPVWDEQAPTRERGRALWREFLRERFIRGGDEDFRYGDVDGDEELDGEARREEEERWFGEEEERWVGGTREGETGVQDY